MNDEQQNKLDALMDELPRDVPSAQDLWPDIEARLSRPARVGTKSRATVERYIFTFQFGRFLMVLC